MAIRLLFIIALLFAILWLLRRIAQHRRRTDETPPRQAESLLRCEHCGVYMTPDQVVRDKLGRTFCSEDHRDGRPDA